MTMNLYDLPPGRTGIIDVILGEGALPKRLAEMGFVRGASITAERAAPLGDPRVYALHGYRICLRNRDASSIRIVTP